MAKKKNNITKNSDGSVTLKFSTVDYIGSVRRELPPVTKVEKPKKGKGSYARKEKHKGRCKESDYGTCFYFCHFVA